MALARATYCILFSFDEVCYFARNDAREASKFMHMNGNSYSRKSGAPGDT